jgi:hypothetical protein
MPQVHVNALPIARESVAVTGILGESGYFEGVRGGHAHH